MHPRGFTDQRGGIGGLVQLLNEHGGAVNYDLISKAGVTIDDIGESWFTWRDFRDFVNNLPPTGDSALYRARYPKSWWWHPAFDFLAAILNTLQWANWQRGGGRGDKPKPIKRPQEQSRKAPKTRRELEVKRDKVKNAIRQRRAAHNGN